MQRTIDTSHIYGKVDKAFSDGFTTVSLQGSARSGKTYNVMIWLVMYALAHRFVKVSVVRATLPALKASALEDFKAILQQLGIYHDRSFNKSDLFYTLPSGSVIEFFSATDEVRLRGRKRDILFVNEANELTELQFAQLKMRTTRFTLIDYNPSFSEDHWICRQVNTDPRTYHFVSTYKDNPFLEQVVIDEIESLQSKNPSLWQIYGLGLMAQIEGLIFKDISLVEKVPVKCRTWYGVDFGYSNDPTAIVEVSVQGDAIYLREIAYRTHMLSGDIIQELKALGRVEVISESADPRLIDEIYHAGINIKPVVKFPGSVPAGISKMLEYKIHITRDSTHIIKEFKNYTWQQDKEGKWLNVPIDAFNHAIDAARYVVLTKLIGRNGTIDLNRIARKFWR